MTAAQDRLSPAAKRLLMNAGLPIDDIIDDIEGSGKDGRILKSDAEDYLAQATQRGKEKAADSKPASVKKAANGAAAPGKEAKKKKKKKKAPPVNPGLPHIPRSWLLRRLDSLSAWLESAQDNLR